VLFVAKEEHTGCRKSGAAWGAWYSLQHGGPGAAWNN